MSKQITIAELRKQSDRVMKFHSLEVNHEEKNLFTVVSGENCYNVEVFFEGRATVNNQRKAIYGYLFNACCNCAAAQYGQGCIHSEKVLSEINKDWNLLFPMFGVEHGDFQALWEMAAAVNTAVQVHSESLSPYVCQLCHKPSGSGTEHSQCHDREQYLSDRQAA